MNLRIVTTVLLLLSITASAIAKKNKNKDKGQVKPAKKPKGLNFNVLLSGGDKAVVSLKYKGNVFTLQSVDKKLGKNGLVKSTIVFDFDYKPPMVVMSLGKGKDAVCYYMDSPVTLGHLKALVLQAQISQDLSFTAETVLDATGKEKSKKTAKKWLKKAKAVRSVCRRSKIVELKSFPAGKPLGLLEKEQIVSFDSFFTLVTSPSDMSILTRPMPMGGGSADKGTQIFPQPRAKIGGGNSIASGGSSIVGGNSAGGGSGNVGNANLGGGSANAAAGGGSNGGNVGGVSGNSVKDKKKKTNKKSKSSNKNKNNAKNTKTKKSKKTTKANNNKKAKKSKGNGSGSGGKSGGNGGAVTTTTTQGPMPGNLNG